MPEKWDSISGLGSVGIELDLNAQARRPQSLDLGHNVRAVGDHLANAGGYALLSSVPEGELPPNTVPGGPADACIQAAPPDEALRLVKANGTYAVNRFHCYEWADKHNFIVAFPVKLNGEDYDWEVMFSKYGLDYQAGGVEGYLRGCRIRVQNSNGNYRVYGADVANDGSDELVRFDYDATTEFTDAGVHWITIRFYRPGSATNAHVYLDGTELFNGSFDSSATGDIEHILQFTLSNYTGSDWLHFAMWDYSPTVFSCLTSGTFQSLGGLPTLDKNPTYRIDPASTNLEHKILWENMIAIAKEPGSTNRVAFYDFLPGVFTGKKYWEMYRVDRQIGTGNPNFWRGCSDAKVNDQVLGQIANSTGFLNNGASLFINGVDKSVSISFNLVVLFACDFDTGDLWIGELRDVNVHETGGTSNWLNNADPSQPATFNIYETGGDPPLIPYTPQIAAGRFEPRSRIELFADSNSCTLAPPTGFTHLAGY